MGDAHLNKHEARIEAEPQLIDPQELAPRVSELVRQIRDVVPQLVDHDTKIQELLAASRHLKSQVQRLEGRESNIAGAAEAAARAAIAASAKGDDELAKL